ncbi:hypothetical protein FRC01_005083 [Tulasnella sp. 417]|nr:hypothetical protein FRC01_005083 [Tulasnella sp. 417]
MATARQSLTAHATGTTTTSSSYRPSSSDSSTHSNPPPPSAAARSLRPLNSAQIPSSSSRARPSTASSSAWVPTFSVSDSQMLNEHTVMSADGFVAIPKSPTTEAHSTSMVGVASAGKEKKEKEKGKKRAKVFALGRLMVKEVLGGGGNGNTPTQKEVIAANGKVPCYGRGGAARPKYQTTLFVPPTPSSAQSAEDTLQAQALRKTLTPLSAPHLPTHAPPPPARDSPRWPPAPATVGPTTTRFSTNRPGLAPHSPPPPPSVGSASVVSAPQYYGEYHHHSQHQYPRPPKPQGHVRRKSSLSLQSATTLTTTSSASFSAKTPSTAQTSPWVGSPLTSSARPSFPASGEVDGQYTLEKTYSSRRRSMSASDINRLAEDSMRDGDPYGQQLQVYGNPLMSPSHLAPLSAEHLDSFVPPVQRKHSMQELQPVRGPRPRPSALSFNGASAAGRPVVPNVVIDHGTPSEEESNGTFASGRPTSPPVARDATVSKRASRPLPKVTARGGASGGDDDTEWVLSESVTVVGFPTTQSSDSFQFDTKEGVKRSASSLGTASPAPTASSTTSTRRESRTSGARTPGVEIQVVREEWSSVPEQEDEDATEVENVEDATPRVQRVVPKAAMAAPPDQPSTSPYASGQQLPVQPFPPPYAAPLPQMQHYLQQAALPQMQGLPLQQNNVPGMPNLLAAPHLAALLPQYGGMVPQAQAPLASAAATPNLLASLAPLLAANQAAMLQQQQQYQQQQPQYQQSQQQYPQPQQQYQQPQQLQQVLELYLALANMNMALSAEQMRNAPSDSQ